MKSYAFWSRLPVERLQVVDDDGLIRAIEDRSWRYSFSVVCLAGFLWMISAIYSGIEPLALMGLIVIFLLVLTLIGPWHRVLEIDPRGRLGSFRLYVAGFIPLLGGEFSLDKVSFARALVERKETVREDDRGSALGCLAGLVLGPFAILLGGIGATKTVIRQYHALIMRDDRGERALIWQTFGRDIDLVHDLLQDVEKTKPGGFSP